MDCVRILIKGHGHANYILFRTLCEIPKTVTGRNQIVFLSTFDHFFDIHVFVIISQNLPECSKLAYSNSYICAVGAPTLGLYVQSIALGKLIELS